jgi:nucleoside-diphosphate-sugar epimerase
MAIRRESSNIELVRKIFSFYTSNPDDYLQRIDWQTGDVLDEESIIKAVSKSKVVYHCAAVVSLGGSSAALLDINVKGTRNVVRAAIECKIHKLCFVSSNAACGYNHQCRTY